MRRVVLGSQLEVGAIGLGCMPMSHAYGRAERDDAESVRVIHRALDLGVTLLDTADIYGPYTNEALIGRALLDRRDRAVVATKCGLVPGREGLLRRDGRPEYIRAACIGSLRRLRSDYLDHYQLHRVDPRVPVEETWGSMKELVFAGLVRTLGISHATVDELDRVHAIHPVMSVQHELSVWAAPSRDAVLPWCRAHRVGLLAFGPLGRGFLTGRLPAAAFPPDDSRSRDPRFSLESMRSNQRLVDTIAAVATRHGATLAQVCLAWVLAQDERVVPIPGTKKACWLQENVAAADLRLTSQDLRELDATPCAASSG